MAYTRNEIKELEPMVKSGKKRFVRYQESEELYSVGLHTFEQIAKEENIEITDADVDAEIEKMATMYNMEADKLKGYMGEDEKENMKQDLAVQKAVELITESVKPRAKAKTKKEKEAEAETEAAE